MEEHREDHSAEGEMNGRPEVGVCGLQQLDMVGWLFLTSSSWTFKTT